MLLCFDIIEETPNNHNDIPQLFFHISFFLSITYFNIFCFLMLVLISFRFIFHLTSPFLLIIYFLYCVLNRLKQCFVLEILIGDDIINNRSMHIIPQYILALFVKSSYVYKTLVQDWLLLFIYEGA